MAERRKIRIKSNLTFFYFLGIPVLAGGKRDGETFPPSAMPEGVDALHDEILTLVKDGW